MGGGSISRLAFSLGVRVYVLNGSEWKHPIAMKTSRCLCIFKTNHVLYKCHGTKKQKKFKTRTDNVNRRINEYYRTLYRWNTLSFTCKHERTIKIHASTSNSLRSQIAHNHGLICSITVSKPLGGELTP